MNGLFSTRKKEFLKDSPISKAWSILKIALILIKYPDRPRISRFLQ